MDRYQLIIYAMLARLGIIRKQQEYKDCQDWACRLSLIAIDFVSIGAFLLLCSEFIYALFSSKAGNLTTNGIWLMAVIFLMVSCFSPVEVAVIARRKIISIIFKEDKEIQKELTQTKNDKEKSENKV